jgi:tripartite-type tricarboxylate transporter receptor subunit TctC
MLFGQLPAQAAGYPSKPIRFYVGFPAGSGTDTAARIIAAKLSDRFGQPVVPDNKSGAGGAIGVDTIAKSDPDGYTIGFGPAGALVIAPHLRKVPYDPLKDIAPVSMVANNPLVIVANSSFPAKNLAELIAAAKARPGKIVFGSSGMGSSMHLAGALLNLMAGINLVHAPYKGNGPAVNDLLGGQIPLAIIDVSTAWGFVQQGRLHAIATTGPTRSITAPEVPTVAESGVKGYSVVSWYGVIAPAGTPPDIIKYLNSNIVAVLNSPDVRKRFLAAGPEPAPSTPEEFGNVIRTDLARWKDVIKRSGISTQ